ncbi:hypothetical protein HYT59_01365 [Candidatus Woesebacteria bacterium]|nr:hypothetical protein [Candidatus Woesebacteria bacterium]
MESAPEQQEEKPKVKLNEEGEIVITDVPEINAQVLSSQEKELEKVQKEYEQRMRRIIEQLKSKNRRDFQGELFLEINNWQERLTSDYDDYRLQAKSPIVTQNEGQYQIDFLAISPSSGFFLIRFKMPKGNVHIKVGTPKSGEEEILIDSRVIEGGSARIRDVLDGRMQNRKGWLSSGFSKPLSVKITPEEAMKILDILVGKRLEAQKAEIEEKEGTKAVLEREIPVLEQQIKNYETEQEVIPKEPSRINRLFSRFVSKKKK